MHQVINQTGSLNGLHPHFKTDKKDSVQYDRSLSNMSNLPVTHTVVPIIGVSPEGAKHLRQELQDHPPQTTLPIDLEGTSLTDRLGKYMVTTPVSHFKEVKQHAGRLLDIHSLQYSLDKFDTAPMLQEQRHAPTNAPEDEDSVVSQDIFGDLLMASASSIQSTMSNQARRQQLLDTDPPIRDWRQNVHVTMPEELQTE
jgi:hypothetical protein